MLHRRSAVTLYRTSAVEYLLDGIMTDGVSSLADLRAAIQQACQSTYVPYIEQGRRSTLAMPQPWVMQYIESIATDSLNLADYWEFRRLLELLDLLGARDAVYRFASLGSESLDADVREAANDYRERMA